MQIDQHQNATNTAKEQSVLNISNGGADVPCEVGYCKSRFPSVAFLKLHQRTQHESVSRKKTGIDDHQSQAKTKIQKTTNSKTFSCNMCSAKFYYFNVLRKHKLEVHKTSSESKP